jgi:hypothetical protein
MFNKLQKSVSETSQSVVPFEWAEFRHIGGGVFNINSNQDTAKISLEFAQYVAIKTTVMFKNYPDVEVPTSKFLKSLVKESKWESFEHEFNKIVALINEHGRMSYVNGETKQQVGVLFNGVLTAVTHANYKPYQHKNIVESIEPIKDFVNKFKLDNEKLDVTLKVTDDDENVKFVVVNGHAGTHAISYHLSYAVGKFSYKIPTMKIYETLNQKDGFVSQRNRHLGDSYMTTDNIEEGFKFLSQFSFKAFVNKIKITDLRNALKEIANELYPDDITLGLLIDKSQGKSAYDILHATALYSNVRGYSVKMQKIISATLDKFMTN